MSDEREILEVFRAKVQEMSKRPGSWIGSVRIDVVAAWFHGFSEALNSGEVWDGFRLWLAEGQPDLANDNHPNLVLREAFPDKLIESGTMPQSLSLAEHEMATGTLLTLFQEYLDERTGRRPPTVRVQSEGHKRAAERLRRHYLSDNR